MSKLARVAAALLLTAFPALGSPCTEPPIPRFGPLAAEPTIEYRTPTQIAVVCRNHDHTRKAGCADEVTNTVYLTDPKYLRNLGWSSTDIACLEKHERAHLWHEDGTRWPGTHRGRVTR